jgi:hypothetical protein
VKDIISAIGSFPFSGLLSQSSRVAGPSLPNRAPIANPQANFSRCTRLFVVAVVLMAAVFPVGASAQLFFPTTEYRVGGQATSFVTVADVNGDGYLDMLVANAISSTVGVRLGNGDGTFWGQAKYASGGLPNSLVAVDVNGDGKLDVVVFNGGTCETCAGDSSVAVLLGTGDGRFHPPVVYDAGGLATGQGLAVVDVNGDGKSDIIVLLCAAAGSSSCPDGDGLVGVLFGNGDGTFQPARTYDTGAPSNGAGLTVADVNGDGKLDVLVTSGCGAGPNCSIGTFSVLLGNGNGTFRPGVVHPTAGWSASGIVTADVNGDGKLDVLVAGCGSSDCWGGSNGVVTVLLGKGNGTFQPPVAYDTGGRIANGLSVSDVNRDGRLDVVVADTLADAVAVLAGNGDGTFQAPLLFPSAGALPSRVAIADLDGDGKPDILVSNCGDSKLACGGIPGTVGVLLSYGTKSQTALTSSGAPSLLGQLVTFTATVGSGSGQVPNGDMVVFWDGKKNKLGTVKLSSGTAVLSTSSLAAGTHYIEALYLGDSSFKRSSAIVKQIVTK